ncbi:MAG: DoxX family protein [Verrucomicrobiaceae bacterium]
MKPAVAWILRIVPAFIMGQTLVFKFLGAAESKALFTTLTEKALGNPGLETVARLGTGVAELVAVILLLIPGHTAKGALLTIGLMGGALASHVAFLGFAGTNGQLAVMAVIALLCAATYLALSRKASRR